MNMNSSHSMTALHITHWMNLIIVNTLLLPTFIFIFLLMVIFMLTFIFAFIFIFTFLCIFYHPDDSLHSYLLDSLSLFVYSLSYLIVTNHNPSYQFPPSTSIFLSHSIYHSLCHCSTHIYYPPLCLCLSLSLPLSLQHTHILSPSLSLSLFTHSFHLS